MTFFEFLKDMTQLSISEGWVVFLKKEFSDLLKLSIDLGILLNILLLFWIWFRLFLLLSLLILSIISFLFTKKYLIGKSDFTGFALVFFNSILFRLFSKVWFELILFLLILLFCILAFIILKVFNFIVLFFIWLWEEFRAYFTFFILW